MQKRLNNATSFSFSLISQNFGFDEFLNSGFLDCVRARRVARLCLARVPVHRWSLQNIIGPLWIAKSGERDYFNWNELLNLFTDSLVVFIPDKLMMTKSNKIHQYFCCKNIAAKRWKNNYICMYIDLIVFCLLCVSCLVENGIFISIFVMHNHKFNSVSVLIMTSKQIWKCWNLNWSHACWSFCVHSIFFVALFSFCLSFAQKSHLPT